MNDTAKAGHYVQVFLAGLCLVFVLIIIIDMNSNYEITIAEDSVTKNTEEKWQATTDAALVAVKPLNEYDQIVERPLFMQDRRPYAPEQVVEASQSNSRNKPVARTAQNDYMLSAVIITGNKRIALLQSNRNNKLQKLNQGDELDGWTLTDVQPAQVSLTKGTEVMQLELVIKGSPKQANAMHATAIEKPEAVETAAPIAVAEQSGATTQLSPKEENKPANPAN